MISLSSEELAQGLHAALGALFVLLPVAMGFHHGTMVGNSAGILFSAVKEFWFDIHYETPETSGGLKGGIKDFSFYLAGMAAANILLFF